jgi:putative ABC transport system substrate-binding protein
MKSLLLAVALLAGVLAEAQQPKKVPRIGYLSALDSASESTRSQAILLALRNLGYLEGQTLSIEYRYAEGKLNRLPELAAELVRLKVDIILVTGGITAVKPAMNATKTIPIVMAGISADPVEAGLVESLARPGANVTGITLLSRELVGKRLEILKEAVPKLTRVAALYESSNLYSLRDVKEVLPDAARALKLSIRPWEIRDAGGLENVFSNLKKDRADGLYLTSSSLMNTNQQRIADFAIKSRLPSMFPYRGAVDAGGLMYYGAHIDDSYRQVAWYVDKILTGRKPADLPVQQPMKFEFVINLKTANQIGLTIPQWTLMKADRVIR